MYTFCITIIMDFCFSRILNLYRRIESCISTPFFFHGGMMNFSKTTNSKVGTE